MVTIGVVGVGSFGEKRAAAAAKISNGKLIGVADLSHERAQDVARKLGVTAFPVEELLGHPQIDVVCISVPNKFHAPLAIQALEYGKHALDWDGVPDAAAPGSAALDGVSRKLLAEFGVDAALVGMQGTPGARNAEPSMLHPV